MTTAGVRITNDSSVLQIDETHPIIGSTHKGTLALTRGVMSGAGSSAIGYQYGSVTITATTTHPLVACAGATENVYGYAVYNGDGTTTISFQASDATFSADTVSWWLFDLYAPASGETAGLRVYDSSSKLIFDSGWGILVPQAVVTSLGNFTYTSGRVYAGMPYQDFAYDVLFVDTFDPFVNLIYYGTVGYKTISNGVNVQLNVPLYYDNGGPSSSAVNSLIVDVTDL